MKLGFIGTGKMGSRIIENLLEKKQKVVVYTKNQNSIKKLGKKGAILVDSYEELAKKTGKQKTIFLMVPHGNPVDDVIKKLVPYLQKGDTIIDGGNSYYKNSIKRANKLSKKKINFLDTGISGGLDGARNGASIMVGGNKKVFKKNEKIFKLLAVKNGYAYLGKSGAGHYAKMVHNAIEYSIMESYSEGFNLLEKSKFDFDMREVSKVYKNGSVIRSWLSDLLYSIFQTDPKLNKQSGIIGGGSTGTWALNSAKEIKIKTPILKNSLEARKKSFKKPDFGSKVVSALRKEFGGHIPPKKN